MKNFVFIDKKVFFFYPEHYKPLLLVSSLAKKNFKIAFFDQKHGLTPLEKCHF